MAPFLLASLLLSAPPPALAPSVADEGVPPLATVASDEGEGGTPDGCLFKYLCYKMPDSSTAAPWVVDGSLKYLVVTDILKFVLSFLPVIGLGSTILALLAGHFFLVDEDVRPALGGDLLLGMIIHTAIHLAWSFLALPLLYLPLGFAVYYGVYGALAFWITPATMLHLYNAEMLKNGGDAADGEDVPRKKKKRSSTGGKRTRRLDDEDDAE